MGSGTWRMGMVHTSSNFYQHSQKTFSHDHFVRKLHSIVNIDLTDKETSCIQKSIPFITLLSDVQRGGAIQSAA
jgi:hypothetical protein